ncbi:MAG: methionine adenosyltransferase, partial [Sphaerochaetaceae bacterium]
DVDRIVRSVVSDIGYNEPHCGFDAESLTIINLIKKQSPDIAMGVNSDTSKSHRQGAGDQGMMFGFACDETPELMPAPIMYAHALLRKATELRKNGKAPFLRPDSKSQVSVVYKDGKPVSIDTVVISHQTKPEATEKQIHDFIMEEVIRPVLGQDDLITKDTKFFINPTGRFVIGGPAGDTGVTGRKIIVDTYGGMGRHGGGAFSGKDPSKVDRSAAYMARFVAKNLVANNLCKKCEVQFSYAIGMPDPISIYVDSFGTGIVEDSKLEEIIRRNFDLSPSGIIETLDLLRPIYQANDNYGHFGRAGVPWENIIQLEK